MKKQGALSILFCLIFAASASALSWAYGFVVLDGRVYEVKPEELVASSDIGDIVGEVKTQADDMTGEYSGDASNFYPIGTKYAEVKGLPVAEVIAVEDGARWLKAVYVYDAPFHVANVLTPELLFIVLVAGLVIGAVYGWRFKRRT